MGIDKNHRGDQVMENVFDYTTPPVTSSIYGKGQFKKILDWCSQRFGPLSISTIESECEY